MIFKSVLLFIVFIMVILSIYGLTLPASTPKIIRASKRYKDNLKNGKA